MIDDRLNLLSSEEKLLLALCRLDFSEEQKLSLRNLMMEVTDWDQLLKLTNEHGVIAMAWYNITNTGNSGFIPPEYLNILHNSYLRNLTRNTYLYDQLTKILNLIKDDGIKIVLLKGMALEKTVYGNRGVRQMTDIDILVSQNDMVPLRRLLMNYGFKSEPFKSPLYKYLVPYLNTHIPRLTKDNCHIEIHNKLFDQKENLLTEEILKFSIPLKIEENTVYIPPTQLFFLYLISHLEHHSWGGDSQLRMYTDLYVLLSPGFEEIINKQLINYAVEANLTRELSGILYLLKTFWKVDFPVWLNEFINQYDNFPVHSDFLNFLKAPKTISRKGVSSKYIKQTATIPGFFRKVIFLAGFIFPSVSFMKKRYKTKTKVGAIFYYPARWGKSTLLFFRGILKG